MFGVVLAAATLYDVLTLLRHKTCYGVGLQSAMNDDGDDDHDSLVNSHQPVIFSRTDDLPLILVTPESRLNYQRASGISSFFFFVFPLLFNWSTFPALLHVRPVP